MAIMNISNLFENNLRKVSEVGVVELNAAIDTSSDRLGQGTVYAKGGDEHIAYTIPADSIASKFYVIVDEVFDVGITADISTIVDGTVIISALPLTSVGATVSGVVDTYFDAVDGIKIVLSGNVTKGKVRVVSEFISLSTNNGTYVDLGA